MEISKNITYIGVNDHKIDLFEGQYKVPNGISYNSYVILDEKTAVIDSVDASFLHEWLNNIDKALNGKEPDYLVVHHMEPDHSANIANFLKVYPNTTVVSSKKAFDMMRQFFKDEFLERRIIVNEGDMLDLGKHHLKFISAPMVHWPEVMMSYEEEEKILFSADAFGKFGTLDTNEDWDEEARRYYIGIVGKYGAQVQNVLKKAENLNIKMICPLHGPVLKDDLKHYLSLYNLWSSYVSEEDGITIAYTSVYGNTKKAVLSFKEKLKELGCKNVAMYDLARDDMSKAVADAFKYNKIVLATTTYNADIFPFMKDYIDRLLERSFQNKVVAIIENGSWAPLAAKTIKEMLSKSKNIEFASPIVTIKSSLSEENKKDLDNLSQYLCQDYIAQNSNLADKNNFAALDKIGYGLYVITSKEGNKDNGLIVNTVTQITNSPNRIAVTINKENYSHNIIKNNGLMNVNCLSIKAPFAIFERFGFISGRTVNKFENEDVLRSDNGLIFLNNYINSFMSLKVENYVDLGTHGMFICTVTEARVINDDPSMTYAYYHENVKPKPKLEGKKGYVCKICGYVYEGDELPEDFICPLCKHGASDFELIE